MAPKKLINTSDLISFLDSSDVTYEDVQETFTELVICCCVGTYPFTILHKKQKRQMLLYILYIAKNTFSIPPEEILERIKYSRRRDMQMNFERVQRELDILSGKEDRVPLKKKRL